MILIDTTGPSSSGPLPAAALSAYLASLRSVLAGPERANPEVRQESLRDQEGPPAGDREEEGRFYISDIILTHWHRDHTEALADVIRTLTSPPTRSQVKVWKFPCADGAEWKSERGREDAALEHELAAAAGPGSLSAGDATAPGGTEVEKGEAGWVHVLRDGQVFRLGPDRERGQHPFRNGGGGSDRASEPAAVEDAAAVELEVVHTPGHTSDSVCLVLRAPLLREGGARQHATPLGVFTADTVLGHGTAVFASLASYLSSLSRLVAVLESRATVSPAPEPNLVPLLPGHGDVVKDGVAKIREYRAHRLERERQVVEALRKASQDERGPLSADELSSPLPPPSPSLSLLHLSNPAGVRYHDPKRRWRRSVARCVAVPARTRIASIRFPSAN